MSLEILNESRYDEIINGKIITFHLHLTYGLVPDGKLNRYLLESLLKHRIHQNKQFNIIFHFSESTCKEWKEKLVNIRKEMMDYGEEWFIMFTSYTRFEIENTIKDIIPKGLVKNEIIDFSLAAQNRH